MSEKEDRKNQYKQWATVGTRMATSILADGDLEEVFEDLHDIVQSFKGGKQNKNHTKVNEKMKNQSTNNNTNSRNTNQKNTSKNTTRNVKQNAIPKIEAPKYSESHINKTNVPTGTKNNPIKHDQVEKLKEAIILSEIIGQPVCKKRRARRI